MLGSDTHEKVCPSCKKVFFPEDKVVKKTFCGDELVCAPSGEKHNAPDCQNYYFCSEECLDKFTEKAPTCTYIPGWKKFMERINKVSKATGVSGTRPHDLHKRSKSLNYK